MSTIPEKAVSSPKKPSTPKSIIRYIIILIVIVFIALIALKKADLLRYFQSKNTNFIATTSSVNRLNNGIEELLGKIEDYNNNIKEEQKKLDTLFNVVEESLKKLQNKDSSTVVNVVLLYKLLDSLSEQGELNNQIDVLLNLSINNNIKDLLKQLQPYEQNNFLTVPQLKDDYFIVHKQLYLGYLKNQHAAISMLKYWVFQLFFITNDDFTQYKTNDIRYTLSYAHFLLQNNNLQQAHQELTKVISLYNLENPIVESWMQHLEVRFFFEDIKEKITNEINATYINQ